MQSFFASPKCSAGDRADRGQTARVALVLVRADGTVRISRPVVITYQYTDPEDIPVQDILYGGGKTWLYADAGERLIGFFRRSSTGGTVGGSASVAIQGYLVNVP